jgi:hypothetical protein
MDSFFAYNAKHNLSMQAFIYRHFTGGFFSPVPCSHFAHAMPTPPWRILFNATICVLISRLSE